MEKVLIISVMTTLLLNYCQMKMPEQSDMPSWSVNIDVPLLKKTITLDELLTDSLITTLAYGDAGDSIFAYEDAIEIEKVEVGDQLEIKNITHSFNQSVADVTVNGSEEHYTSEFDEVGVDPITQNVESKLGKISLDDTDPERTSPIVLTDIVDLSGVDEGQTASVDQGTSFPTIYREITFNDFNNAEFTSGVFEINIINDLVIELGAPLTVRFLDADSSVIIGIDGDSAKAEWDTGIQPSSSALGNILLAGKTLPGTIIVKITGVICGSGSDSITNNVDSRNSSFVVQVQAKNLEVSSAEAIIPEQMIDTTGVIMLAESENKVQSAKIQNGTLEIDIDNDLPIDANLLLTISSIDVSDDAEVQPFTQTIPLNAKEVSNKTYSLADNYLVMDINDQKIVYSYQIVTIATDPEKVKVTENDGVVVDISLYGQNVGEQITFSEFEGKVAQEPILESGEIAVTSDSKITEAVVSSGTLTINIRNGINQIATGVPQLTLNIPEFIDQGNNPIQETRNLNPEPNTTSIVLNLSGYKLRPNLVEVSPDSFTQNISYHTKVVVPRDQVSSYNLQGSIAVDIIVSELTFSSVTGYFTRDAIVEEDVIELDEATKIELADISRGELVLKVTNNIGAVANIDFQVDEIINKYNDKPLQRKIQLTTSTDPVIEYISLDSFNIELPVVDFTSKQEIHYRSTISIPSDEEMTLTFGNYIDVRVEMKDIAFNEVKGYIDTVTVDIDSVEQEINALPEELSGIDLANVEIVIDFDTNIGVPVILDLTITAANDDGDFETVRINQNITENHTVIVPDAKKLINIKPSIIVSYGKAAIGGSGTVSTDQYVQGTMYITVPMEMIIKEGASIDLEPELVETEIPEIIESITINSITNNLFEFGGNVQVLAAKDTLYFDDSSPVTPDTLAIVELFPDSNHYQIITLDESKFALFEDSLYVKALVKLIGMTDESGDPIPSRLLKNDSLQIQLHGSIKGLIDLKENDN